MYVFKRQHDLEARLAIELEAFRLQQLTLLQSLSQQMLTPIQQNDLAKISASLRAYEDLSFIFAKTFTAVPVNVYFVSLTAPGLLLSGGGKLDMQMLAADEDYYLRLMNNPTQINFSKTYINSAMPEYTMLHWGIGVMAEDINLGQLDVKVSLKALNTYFHHKINTESLFEFKIILRDHLQAALMLNQTQYWSYLMLWLFFSLGTGIVVLSIIAYGRNLYLKNVQQQQTINTLQQENHGLICQVKNYKLASDTQYAYGILAITQATEIEQLIKLQQLLQDIRAVNAEFAASKNVSIKLTATEHVFAFYGHKLRLMQILSGMLFEIINELSIGAVIELQFVLSNVAHGMQKIIFKFIDNGFYSQLFDRDEKKSAADIRVRGWQNIRDLIALEDGLLQHEHVVYQGNTISLHIVRRVANNVIVLEQLARQ